jgi:ABC-type ATPase involved in cell division
MTGNNQNPIIQMQDVVKVYSSPFVALNDVNLDINPREFLGITGKSDVGVTALLSMIFGVSKLSSWEEF